MRLAAYQRISFVTSLSTNFCTKRKTSSSPHFLLLHFKAHGPLATFFLALAMQYVALLAREKKRR